MSARAGSNVIICHGSSLDYSFKEFQNVQEMETEEPRSGKKKSLDKENNPGDVAANDEAQADPETKLTPAGANSVVAKSGAAQVRVGAAPAKNVINKVTTCVKLNNNQIERLSSLQPTLEKVMVNPFMNLQWIDLSHNLLQTIDKELLHFPNLKAIYLAGNKINSLPAVEKLKKLPQLISLTLNGNPIEGKPCYRNYVIGALPHLRKLDHSPLSDADIESAQKWLKGHQQRLQKKKDEAQYGEEFVES